MLLDESRGSGGDPARHTLRRWRLPHPGGVGPLPLPVGLHAAFSVGGVQNQDHPQTNFRVVFVVGLQMNLVDVAPRLVVNALDGDLVKAIGRLFMEVVEMNRQQVFVSGADMLDCKRVRLPGADGHRLFQFFAYPAFEDQPRGRDLRKSFHLTGHGQGKLASLGIIGINARLLAQPAPTVAAGIDSDRDRSLLAGKDAARV